MAGLIHFNLGVSMKTDPIIILNIFPNKLKVSSHNRKEAPAFILKIMVNNTFCFKIYKIIKKEILGRHMFKLKLYFAKILEI